MLKKRSWVSPDHKNILHEIIRYANFTTQNVPDLR